MKSFRELFLAWLKVGTLAFGGGNVALEAIRREFVERLGWVEEETFARDWALCSASPGINLLCLTILMGRRLGGWPGVFASLLGMVIPSAAITLVIAAGFGAASGAPAVRAAMRGVVPATVGLGLASVYRAGVPLLRRGWKRGGTLRAATFALPALGLVGLMGGLSPVVLLLGGSVAGTGLWWWCCR